MVGVCEVKVTGYDLKLPQNSNVKEERVNALLKCTKLVAEHKCELHFFK
jgi:hypothetical protein